MLWVLQSVSLQLFCQLIVSKSQQPPAHVHSHMFGGYCKKELAWIYSKRTLLRTFGQNLP